MRHTALKALVLSGLIVAAASAFAQKKYDTGASDTEIKIGNIVPYSGPASAYGVEAVGGVPQNLQQSLRFARHFHFLRQNGPCCASPSDA